MKINRSTLSKIIRESIKKQLLNEVFDFSDTDSRAPWFEHDTREEGTATAKVDTRKFITFILDWFCPGTPKEVNEIFNAVETEMNKENMPKETTIVAYFEYTLDDDGSEIVKTEQEIVSIKCDLFDSTWFKEISSDNPKLYKLLNKLIGDFLKNDIPYYCADVDFFDRRVLELLNK